MASGNAMVWTTELVDRSILTSLGPPGTTASVLGDEHEGKWLYGGEWKHHDRKEHDK